jgi:hypothetical protein
MKKFTTPLYIFITFGIVIFLGQCGFHNKDFMEGSLMLTISQENFTTKTVTPPVEMEIAYYVISGEGLGGAQLEEVVVGVNDLPIEIGPLSVGDWTIYVHAWNDHDGNGEWDSASDKWIGWGSTNVKIKAREQAQATVEVRPRTDEPGVLRVNLSWDVGLLSVPTVTGTLTHVTGNPVHEIALSVGDGITEDGGVYEAVYEKTGLDPGYYSLLVYLNDAGQAVWGAFEAVRILAEWESIYDQEIGPSDISPGGIDLGIEPDMRNPVQVTLEGVQDIMPPFDQITVFVTTVPPDPDTYEYLWYVNGIHQQEVDGAEITIGRIGTESDIELIEGNYRLDVGVLSGETISSGTACFGVSTEAPVTYSISGNVSYDTGSGVIGFRGVTMSLSGGASDTVTTDESGNYVFSGLAEGSYVVSPSSPGYSFSGDWAGILITDVTDTDFTATGPAYTISGYVQGRIGGVPGAEMTLDTTPPLTVLTEGWGGYTTASVPNGIYTLTPSLPGSRAAFYPPEKTLTVADANLTDQNFQTTILYDVSGSVSYAGTRTGRVYIHLVNEWGWNMSHGTCFEVTEPGTWPFTIRGVQSGTYTLNAYMDNIGQGVRNASNPTGESTPFGVVDSDVNSLSITLTDPTPVAPEPLDFVIVLPANQGAGILWEGFPTDENDLEIAQSYNVYWSTDPNMGTDPGEYDGMASVPAGLEFPLYILTGLSDDEDYYFIVSACADGQSADSPTVGPVDIGASTGDWTVSGYIYSSGMDLGPMFAAVVGESDEEFVVCSQYIPFPSSSQYYSISGVPDGFYQITVFIDMNENGYIDIGDVKVGYEGEIMIEVTGDVTRDITIDALPTTSVNASTSHSIDAWGEYYSVEFEVNTGSKLPVCASLVSGPNIPGAIDFIDVEESEFGVGLDFYSTSPNVGDTYSFDVTFSDGVTESMQASVTAVLDSFATQLYPIGDISGDTRPTFTWAHPVSPPPVYTYEIGVSQSAGEGIWWANEIPGSDYFVDFNFNDEAEQDPLDSGTSYYWWITVVDDDGNEARSDSVEFTP